MQRDLKALENHRFDLAVIGGGATGALIAREAAHRGCRVALIEQDDFSQGTSATNSRLIHGGLRYLARWQLGVVKESLRERSWWLRAAPHLVSPLPFVLPARSRLEQRLSGAGLRLYDHLGRTRDDADAETAGLRKARPLSDAETRSLVPYLHAPAGAWLYHDAQMHAPERLVLAALTDVVRLGGTVANHLAALRVRTRAGQVEGIEAKDRESGDRIFIGASRIVNATGAWCEQFLDGTGTHVTRSEGIHLITRKLAGDVAVALKDNEGHLFLLPWRGHTLIGTTDTRYDGDAAQYQVFRATREAFVARVEKAVPRAGFSSADVITCYGGLRTLVGSHSRTYGASRQDVIIDHCNSGRRGLYSVLGGKWTTSRAQAQRFMDHLGTAPSSTLIATLPGCPEMSVAALIESCANTFPGIQVRAIRHLVSLYGSQAPTLLAEIEESEDLLLDAPEPLYCSQAVFAARHEMARTLADLVLRRTTIGLLGDLPRATLAALAKAMGQELGWSQDRRSAEIASLLPGGRAA